jgi:hypothetical protein
VTSATLPATGIVHHTALLPLSEGSVAIDDVLGAMNYRSLPADEAALDAGRLSSFTNGPAERQQWSSADYLS